MDVIKEIQHQIDIDKQYGSAADYKSFNSKQGILLTRNEAQTIIDSYDLLKAAFEELLANAGEQGIYYTKQWRCRAGLLPDQQKGGTAGRFYDNSVCKNCGCVHTEDNIEKCFLNKKRSKEQYLSDLTNGINPFPITDEEVGWFENEIKDIEVLELPDIFKSYFSFVYTAYLKREKGKGSNEFRISFQGDKKFIIHPLGRDGETMDKE